MVVDAFIANTSGDEAMPDRQALRDRFGRGFAKLRVSLTPACNFRCTYCRPATGIAVPPAGELLTFDEIERTCRVAASLGMKRVRLTGGEPLVRPGAVDLVRRLARLGLDVAMTTNGSLLRRYAPGLAEAGLSGVNISLDTLDRQRAADLARADVLPGVLDGIEAALEAGLRVKLNCVAMPGVNDGASDLADLCRYAIERGVPLRFIEYMPMGVSGGLNGGTKSTVTAAEVRRRLASAGVRLSRLDRHNAADPAEPFAVEGGGEVGFIHSISEHFCEQCDRMRVTAEGELRPCLHQDVGVDLRRVLRGGGDDAQIIAAFAEAAGLKWASHRMGDIVPLTVKREMVTIGG